jgi:tRNA-binding EMAP/Myf-like protein
MTKHIDVSDLERHLADGATIDEEAGSLIEGDRQVIRVGKVVRISTHDGAEAAEHSSVDAAKKAFKDAAP